MTLSEKIAQVRETKKITKADMAKVLEMDFSNYHRLENRGDKLTLEQVGKIAQALGVSVMELLTWGEVEPQTQMSVDIAKENEKLREQVQELTDRLTDLREMYSLKAENLMLREEAAKAYYIQMKDLEEKINWEDNDNNALQMVLLMVKFMAALGGMDKDDNS